MGIQFADHNVIIIALEFQTVVQCCHFVDFFVFVRVDNTGNSVFAIYSGFAFADGDVRGFAVFTVNADLAVFAVLTDGDVIAQGEVIGCLTVFFRFLDRQVAVGFVLFSVDLYYCRFSVGVNGVRQVGNGLCVLIRFGIHDFQLRHVHRVIGIRTACNISNAAVVLRDRFVANSICFIADRYDAVFFFEGFLG